MTYCHLTKLKYHEQTREEKRKIYAFIKRVYPSATKKDVISGLHTVGIDYNQGRLYYAAVLTDLSMI